MLHTAARAKRFLVAVLILLEIFGVGTPVAYAQVSGLSSLITTGISSAAGAAISCNRGAISKGIGSLFGVGSQSDAPTVGRSGSVVPPTSPSSPTTDQKLDLPANGAGTNTWSGGSGLDGTQSPTAGAGSTNDFSGLGGPSASSPSNDTSGMGSGGSSGNVGTSAVPVVDANNPTGIKDIAAQTAATNKKLTCTNAVEKAASQAILKQLTIDTVNWINHGFAGGSSFFPKDTQSFLKSIGDQEVKQFTATFAYDSKNYPFGRSVMQGITSQLSNTFAQNAKYSLDAVIAEKSPGMTTENFTADFANGGWAAFNSQFSMGNNPVGFTLATQNQLAQRTEDTVYSPGKDIQDQLQRAGGLLDTKVCVSPKTYDSGGPGTSDPIAAQARINLNNAAAAEQTGGANSLLTSLEAQQRQKLIDNTCVKWQTQTPGSVVSATLNEALSTPFKNLELGQDLSTDLTAVFNALTNQLAQKGLSSLSDSSNTSSNTSGKVTYTNNSSYVPNIIVDGSEGSGTNFLAAGDEFQTNIFDLDPSGKEAIYSPTGGINLGGTTFNNFNASQLNTQSANNTAANNNSTTFSNPTLGTGTTGTTPSPIVIPTNPPVQRTNLIGLINREQQLVATSQQTADSLAAAMGWTPAQEKVWIASMQARDPNYTNLLGKQVNLGQRLIPAAYELDFCVPGPHPGWEADSQARMQAFLTDPYSFPQSANASDLAKFGQKYGKTIGTVVGLAAGVAAGAAIGATAGSVVPGLGTAIGAVVGVVVGIVITAVANDQNHKEERAYAPVVERYLNVSIDSTQHREHVNGYKNSTDVFYTFAQDYIGKMETAYTDTALIQAGISPDLLAADRSEMANIPRYAQAISSNSQTVSDVQVTISQLTFLGKRIHDLEMNVNHLDGYPNPAPRSYQDFQDQLTAINGVTNTSKLTAYQLELRRINDTFNLIAPDLLANSDIAAQEAALDSVAAKLENIAGTGSGSLLNECVDEVNHIAAIDPKTSNEDGAPLAPLGRIPFPADISQYLAPSFMSRIKYSISFLPDYYYGNGKTGRSAQLVSNTATKVPVPEFFEGNDGENRGVPVGDPDKTINSDNVLQINVEQYPYALAGLEYVMGIY